MSPNDGKSTRYWPVAEVAVAVTVSVVAYEVFRAIVVGLPGPPPSLLVSVAAATRPAESSAYVVDTCGAVLWLPPFTKYVSTWVGATSQTATGFSGSSSLTRLPALSPVTPAGGHTAWYCVLVTCWSEPSGLRWSSSISRPCSTLAGSDQGERLQALLAHSPASMGSLALYTPRPWVPGYW